MGRSNGDVVREVAQEHVAVQTLQIVDAAPPVAAEGFGPVVFDVPLNDGRLPGADEAVGPASAGRFPGRGSGFSRTIVRITVMVLTATPDHERNVAVEDGRQRSRRFMAARPRG